MLCTGSYTGSCTGIVAYYHTLPAHLYMLVLLQFTLTVVKIIIVRLLDIATKF